MPKKISSLLSLAVLPALAGTAAAAEGEYTLSADYDGAVLGIHAAGMHAELTLKDGGYTLTVTAQPEGIAATFTRNAITAKASGQGEPGKVEAAYSWIQQVGKKVQTVEMHFENGNPVAVKADPAYPPSPNDPTEEQKLGTIDPMNAVMHLFLLPAAGQGADACGGTLSVYDGRRRYNLPVTSEGMIEVDGDAGGYAGPAVHCIMGYQRIAGWNAEKLAKGSDTVVHFWAAPIGKGANGGPAFWLPVRIWSDTEIGRAVATPTNVMINGKPWGQFFAEGG